MVRWAMVVGLVAACERMPVFTQPPAVTGGFIVRCEGITDLALRHGQCDPSLANSDILRGACLCAQPTLPLAAPRLNCPGVCSPHDVTELAGALTFADTSCNTNVADTCVPTVIPTSGSWQQAMTPPGQLRMDMLLNRIPDSITVPQASDVLALGGTTSNSVANTVARDAYNELRSDCNLAQWNSITQSLTGFVPGSLDWSS